VLGVGLPALADEAADDLQAGIDAFNSGDLPGAMALYEKAAEAGSPEAQVRLAYLLDYAEDNEMAVHWYRAAADQDYPDGIGGLAEMYAKGEGVPKDLAQARELFEKAGEAGHAPSIRVLIGAYDRGGLDVERNESRLAYWREKLASLNTSED
jgi:TPR repeat protein